jgi:flotillin
MDFFIIATVVGIIAFVIILSALFKRYKRCPSDRILVVFGKGGQQP